MTPSQPGLAQEEALQPLQSGYAYIQAIGLLSKHACPVDTPHRLRSNLESGHQVFQPMPQTPGGWGVNRNTRSSDS